MSSVRVRLFNASALLTPLLIAGAIGGCWSNATGRVSAQRTGDLSQGEPVRGAYDASLVAACGEGGVTDEGSRSLLRAPYLQRTTRSSTVIAWTSSADAPGEVVVTRPDASEQPIARVPAKVDTSAPIPGGRQLTAEITGLEPYTVYCYEIVSSTGTTYARTGFRTSPAPDATTPIRFATLGDLGTASDEQFDVVEQMKGLPIDLVVLNGDIAYEDGTLEQFENHYFAVYADMLRNIPFFPASGNHDYNTADAAAFRQAFVLFENGGKAGRERWYSFDWGSVHFVVLDTEKTGVEQARWLDEDLQANKLPWVVVSLHRPPFSSGNHGGDAKVRGHFVPLFQKYGVQLVLGGHDHHYERSKVINGVTYLISGAGGRGTRGVGNSSFTAFAEAVTHFTHVEVNGNKMVLRAIDATGKVFDTALIERR